MRGTNERERNDRLYASFTDWCKARSIKNPISPRAFGRKLTDKGMPAKTINGPYWRIGVRLKTKDEVVRDRQSDDCPGVEDIYRESRDREGERFYDGFTDYGPFDGHFA